MNWDGYSNIEKNINEICEMYGQGKNATSARSITIEDINKLTGYDSSNIDGNGTVYAKGTVSEYGNKVKYMWGNDKDIPYNKSTNGKSPSSDTKVKSYKEEMIEKYGTGIETYLPSGYFRYYNGSEFVKSSKPSEATDNNKVDITEIENNYYCYSENNYPEQTNDKIKALIYTSGNYLTSSTYEYANEYGVEYGVFLQGNRRNKRAKCR